MTLTDQAGPTQGKPCWLSTAEPPLASTLLDAVEEELKAAIARRFGVTPRLTYIDAVSGALGRFVSGGIVLVFELGGQPEAERAYAWLSPKEDGDGHTVNIVLHGLHVRSAHDAFLSRSPLSAPTTGPARSHRS